jgi:methionyl-tRNA formyltransferase
MKEKMNIVFAGTSDFGIYCLDYLNDKFNVIGVITNPDKPAGRGRKIRFSAIKNKAIELNLKLFQFKNINERENLEVLKKLNPDLIIVIAYGKIISAELLELFENKWINVHASLLPDLRGPAPINYAVMNGLKKTGITIMNMNEKMDEGDILYQKDTPISDKETFGELYEKLQNLSVGTLEEYFCKLSHHEIIPSPQKHKLASYTKKITSENTRLDLTASCKNNYLKIKGLNPIPCAWVEFKNKKLKIYDAEFNYELCGKIDKDGFYVTNKILALKCSDGFLVITDLKYEGKRRMDSKSFLNGLKL